MNDRMSHMGIIVTILAFWIATLFSLIFGKYTNSAEAAQGIVPRSATFRPVNTTATTSVTVTNSSDVVNGDISNIPALISNPGIDGISFREALDAANGTSGPKSIVFDLSLVGATITFAADGDLLALASGELTINGDINQDGEPDITLDGHLGQGGTPTGPGLSIISSDNTINGLSLF
jgi:hypothetical protein